jgi:hypothetical protein
VFISHSAKQEIGPLLDVQQSEKVKSLTRSARKLLDASVTRFDPPSTEDANGDKEKLIPDSDGWSPVNLESQM